MAAVSLRRRASVALVPLCFLSSCNLIEQSIQDRVAGTFNVSIGWPGGRAPPGLA